MAPLRRKDAAPAANAEPAESAQGSEREALYAAMRDLEEDFETGKLSSADHAVLREELRGRAAVLLQAEREATRQRPAVVPTQTECGACGAALRTGDRFCGQCGVPVAAADAPSREASA
jgi:hypothetical protein